jgi:CHAT domain-containing protein
LHVAAHAVGNPSFPALARLIMAPSIGREDGAVYARELRYLRPRCTRLVVLATCGALSDGTEGTEVQIIFIRAFLAAGVPSVVGSLWKVEDSTASFFYVELHRRIRNGQAPAEALRGAQIAMLHAHGGAPRVAYAWASFEVFGGWSPL